MLCSQNREADLSNILRALKGRITNMNQKIISMKKKQLSNSRKANNTKKKKANILDDKADKICHHHDDDETVVLANDNEISNESINDETETFSASKLSTESTRAAMPTVCDSNNSPSTVCTASATEAPSSTGRALSEATIIISEATGLPTPEDPKAESDE